MLAKYVINSYEVVIDNETNSNKLYLHVNKLFSLRSIDLAPEIK